MVREWAVKSVGSITMFIQDTQRSRAFYEQVFGAEVVYEDENAVAFKFENMVVNLLRVSAAHELIAPAPVGGLDAARRFQLTVWVQDTDVVCEQLAARGVELLNGPMDRRVGPAHGGVQRSRWSYLGGRGADPVVS